MTSEELTAAVLNELSKSCKDNSLSVNQLTKCLNVNASTLMRHLAGMGPMPLGEKEGPGWITMELKANRWTVQLTQAGQSKAQSILD